MKRDFLDEAYDAFVKSGDPNEPEPCRACGDPFYGPNYPGIFDCPTCGAKIRVEFRLTAHTHKVP